MPQINTGAAYHLGSTPVQKLYVGTAQVWPQAPILSSIAPTSMLHLSGATTITATGSNFKSGCVLQIKLTSASTWTNVSASTVVSKTQMTGSVDMYPANWEVSVVDAQGRRTAELPFQGQHNTPTLTEVSPISRFLSGGPGQVYCVGSNYYAAGSGYTGLHLFMLRPGGGWEDKGQMVIQNSTDAYLNGIDPGVVGVWQVMVGYDNPNTTRSGQKPFEVKADPPPPDPTPTVTSADGFGDQWMGGTIDIYGTNFVAPMYCNLQDSSGCTINEDFDIPVTVDSPTHARWIYNSYEHGHNSINTVDSTHTIRVQTPNGLSAWCANQPIGFN